MAQVYLPFGYPQLSGMEFANVIYQGEMVRLYTVPTDPRNDAQLQQRYVFADLARMRGTLGTFGRAVARIALGSRWTGVLTQIVKADVSEWWTGALDRWDGFAEISKNAWRNAALNQASYNDVGGMYYACARTLADALLYYTSDLWGVQAWGEADSAAATTWWTRNIANYISSVMGNQMTRGTGWTVNGGAIQSGASGAWAWSWWSGRRLAIQFRNPSGNPSITVRVNGVNYQTFTVTANIDQPFDFGTNALRQIYVLKNDAAFVAVQGLVKPTA